MWLVLECACSACLRVRFRLIVSKNSRVKLWWLRLVPVSRIKASFRFLQDIVIFMWGQVKTEIYLPTDWASGFHIIFPALTCPHLLFNSFTIPSLTLSKTFRLFIANRACSADSLVSNSTKQYGSVDPAYTWKKSWSEIYLKLYKNDKFNPLAPEPPITANADPHPFHCLWRHQF